MSSRALRKLQREQERKKQPDSSHAEEDDGDEEVELAQKKPFNAFDVLNDGGDDSTPELLHSSDEAVAAAEEESADTERAPPQENGTQLKPRKKKKRKNKATRAKTNTSVEKEETNGPGDGQDEIDAALASLSMKAQDGSYAISNVKHDEADLQMCRLLAVESRHLNAINEMKRLFGNVTGEEETPSPARRRGRGPQQIDLGGALAARYSPVSKGQGLSGLALRRNVFMNGKEEWPKATSGGLGMETDGVQSNGTKKYRFVHNAAYQDVQRQFVSCVESMDPERMILMLQFNPYHISTLLQVSEIAKQQGDHSVSGDLLERALFSFGRSVHSSFSTALAEGRARLDFRRPENREFWLAAWRYVANLGQRGTWRTAYEWAKLLLSLDPEGDPYCIRMSIDQLALRGGQAEHFLDLTSTLQLQRYTRTRNPNIEISKSLAEYKLKHAQECRASLARAVSKYPFIFARLFKELNIEHIPPSIWGKEPRTDRETFECETYVVGAKDIWNTPEHIQFLVEVTESCARGSETPLYEQDIQLSEARHVLLSNNPRLIGLVPRSLTSMPSTASDPLPPNDSINSYSIDPPASAHAPPPAAYIDPFESDNNASGADTDDDLPTAHPSAEIPSTPPETTAPADDDQRPWGILAVLNR
ncbi:MAG: hypothetical protein Q9191_007906, partial [Dirinaria sp. TL-2023a]